MSHPHGTGIEALIPQIVRDLRTAMEGGITPLGITPQQGALILRVGLGERSPGRLASELCTDTAGITRLLDRLEEKGLLRRGRHPGDRRAVVVGLTAEGERLLPRIAPIFEQVSTRLLDGLSEAERRTATDLLNRMAANLRDA